MDTSNYLYLTSKHPEEFILSNESKILNFFNMNSVFWYFRSRKYNEIISRKQNIMFPDGKILALKLEIKQQKGPLFTRRFLLSDIIKDKKHFFIGLNKQDIAGLSEITNISSKNFLYYNPPYIKEIEFASNEREKIIRLLKKSKPDYVWVCVGSPKQEILANQLYLKYKAFYFNVGAAMDFFLKKKKEAPKIFTSLGIEWLYRLVTDFRYSRIKVWRSFIALRSLKKVKMEK